MQRSEVETRKKAGAGEKKGTGAGSGMDLVLGRMEIHFALFARDIDTRRSLLKDTTVRNFAPGEIGKKKGIR